MGEALIFLGLLIFLAHLFSMIFSKKRIPDVLLLIFIGIIIGPLLGIVLPSFMGQAGQVFTTIVLIFILFDAGTDISISDIKNAWKPTITLSLSSVIASIVLTTLICMAFQITFINSLIIGIVLSGTSSAVVIPLTQQLNLGKDTKTALVLESAITDVICFVLALAFMQSAMEEKNVGISSIAGGVISSFVMATLIGFVSGLIWSSLLQKVRTFKNSMFLTPAYVFVVYGVSEYLGFSGAISALSVGITISNIDVFKFKFMEKFLKNKHHTQTDNEKAFVSEIVFVLKTFFFVYIGISIPFNNGKALIIGFLITIILLIMRIFIAKFFSPKSSNAFDKSIISLMIPKGLAAAVLASIPEQMGIEGGSMIKYIVYAVVFFSILVCSVMIYIIEQSPKFNILKKFFKDNINTENNVEEILTENSEIKEPYPIEKQE
ncbi:MAG: cation:proton antiporter [Bacteroidales bacterium]|jgi:NhaP-type Na+/H+ or K+/H+ antiporter|nr:cation:proton antiporter [Bacteroidales bacterium]